eukprot:scaffold1008_cov124-Cylindrotheca_fusiformis.AAC.12
MTSFTYASIKDSICDGERGSYCNNASNKDSICDGERERVTATSLISKPLNDLSVTELPQGSGWEFGSTICKSRDSDLGSQESEGIEGIHVTLDDIAIDNRDF